MAGLKVAEAKDAEMPAQDVGKEMDDNLEDSDDSWETSESGEDTWRAEIQARYLGNRAIYKVRAILVPATSGPSLRSHLYH